MSPTKTQRRPSILQVFALLAAAGLVTPVITMDVVDGQLERSVYFTIPVSLPSQYRIDWNSGHTGRVTVITRVTSGRSPQYNPLYTGRCQLFGNGTLRLDNISYADEGTYKVKVFNPDTFTSYIQRYQLNIYAMLSAPVLISSTPLISGTDGTLHCDAGNQTVTTYTFYRDEKMICSEPHVTCRGSFLDFTPISEKDSGSYTCRVQNPVSANTSATIGLTVSVPVSSVTLTSNTSGLLWPGRDSLSLLCSARGTEVTYSWSLEDAPLPENPRYHFSQNNSTLIIHPVSSDDTRPLSCTASNWVNKETSDNLSFTFASPVSAVTLTSNTSAVLWAGQDSVSLYCAARGSAITFSWSLNGSTLSPNPPYYITQSDSPPHSNLTISPISRSDTGPFTCTASNLANSETSDSVNLSLNLYPEGNIACIIQGHDTVLQLDCSWPGGRPAANVTMIFNDMAESGPHGVTRNVSVGDSVHRSNLTCIGDHLGRTLSCGLIFGKPRPPQRKNKAPTAVTKGEVKNLKTEVLP